MAKKKEEPTAPKPTSIQVVSRKLNMEEMFDITREQNQILAKMRELDGKKKAYVATIGGEIKTLDARIAKLTEQFESGLIFEEVVCYVHNNYLRQEIQYIECKTGDVVRVSPMPPSQVQAHLNRQMSVEEELAEQIVSEKENDGYAFFTGKLYEELDENDSISEELLKKLNDDYYTKIGWIGLLIDHLYAAGKLGETVGFDTAYDVAEEWYKQFVDSLEVGPVDKELVAKLAVVETPPTDTQAEGEPQTETPADPNPNEKSSVTPDQLINAMEQTFSGTAGQDSPTIGTLPQTNQGDEMSKLAYIFNVPTYDESNLQRIGTQLATFKDSTKTLNDLEKAISEAWHDLNLPAKQMPKFPGETLYEDFGVEPFFKSDEPNYVIVWHESSNSHIAVPKVFESFRTIVLLCGIFYETPDNDGMIDVDAFKRSILNYRENDKAIALNSSGVQPIEQAGQETDNNKAAEPESENKGDEQPTEQPKKAKRAAKAKTETGETKPSSKTKSSPKGEPTGEGSESITENNS